MIRCRSVFVLLLLLLTHAARAVVPGGIYGTDNSIHLSLDPKLLPHMMGYHLVRGSVLFHNRSIPFCTAIFIPRAFVHAQAPMPIVMTLHNKFGIGDTDGGSLAGEGLAQILAYGVRDPRADGDTPDDAIPLRHDAQFIGLAPQCPAGHTWEDPFMARLLGTFLDQIVDHYHADADRVYLTGFSYGASSSWQLALHAPDRFAAIVPCDGRATADPIHDVEKLKNIAIYLEVGGNDGEFVDEADRMHQALAALPHPNFIFHQIPGGNHFNYGSVYTDPQFWKWLFAQHRMHAGAATQPVQAQGSPGT